MSMTERIEPEQTFCGVPFCADLGTLEAEVAVLGAPHGTPYEPGTPSHAAGGARAVRGALGWYSSNPEQFDFDSMGPLFGGARVVDCGDVTGDLHDGARNRHNIETTVRGVRAHGAVPLLLGGDDSVPIPLFRAYSEVREITIVQIDAHIDWRDELRGVREGFSSTMRRASEMTQIERIIQIGARGPGSARAAELEDARAWGAFIHTARAVHAQGVGPALDRVPAGAEVILSIDVDGIDPAVVPGVILPAFGGLGYQQVLDVIHGVAAKAKIVGAAFVEYVPEKDPTGTGAQAIARLASNVIAAVGGQARP
ncbi:MAG: arginase family protein [Alphaproteobacteria bacterium]